MVRFMLVIVALGFIFSCNPQGNDSGSVASKYPKDPNITKETCLQAGENCDFAPSETITDKCCDGLTPSEYSASQDGSTGYSHYTCVHADKCTGEDQAVATGQYTLCCAGLIIMDGKCVNKDRCDAGKEQILVSGGFNQKKCVNFPSCVESGSVNPSVCEYCCAGSKYTTQEITGTRPQKCLGPNENLTQDESKYGWSDPKVISKAAYDKFKTDCLSSHHP